MGIASDIVLIVTSGLLVNILLYRFNIPLLIGYIFAGILIGPHVFSATVSDINQIEMLAEIGVAFLLFSLGLELSFRELRKVKYIAIIGTPIQLLLTAGFAFPLALAVGFSLQAAIWFGAAASLSSTMIVLKLLMSRKLLGTLSGKVMTGILIIQDISAIPMMILLPQMAGAESDISSIGRALLKIVIFLTLLILLGRKILPVFLRKVASMGSKELFLLTLTTIGLGVGYATHAAGLSFAFGAFIAGILLNESEFSHQALSDIEPLRDIFGLFFFTSIGMLFDPVFISHNYIEILLLAGTIMAGKALIFAGLSRAFRYRNIIPLATAMGLSQVGEFSFVLIRTGQKAGAFSQNEYSTILAAIVITMIISPFISARTSQVYAYFTKNKNDYAIDISNAPLKEIDNHVVIAGCGRIGAQVAQVLSNLNNPFVIIEADHWRYELMREKGYTAIFGQAASRHVLSAAALADARLLLITFDDLENSLRTIEEARHVKPDIKIIARAKHVDNIPRLAKAEIFEVVQPELEASLEIIRQTLLWMDVSAEEVETYCENVRRHMYSPLTESVTLNAKNLYRSLRHAGHLNLHWGIVTEGSHLRGKNLVELDIRNKTGVSILAVFRDDKLISPPEPDYIFKMNDRVAYTGSHESIQNFSDTFLKNVNI